MSTHTKNESTISPSKRPHRISPGLSAKESPNPVSDYLTRATDTLGNHTSLSFTMSPEVRRVAAILIRSEVFPFRTEPDVWRWCINFGLAELAKRSRVEEAISEVRMHRALIRTLVQEMENVHYERQFAIHKRAIATMIETGHIVRAEQAADEIWKAMDATQDPYWRKIWRDRSYELVLMVKKAKAKAAAAKEQP